MKYLKFAFSCTAAFAALSAGAETGFRFEPYFGAAYQYSSLDYATNDQGVNYGDFFDNSLNGGGIYLGARLHDYFGIEFGASKTREGEKTATFTKEKLPALLIEQGFASLTENIKMQLYSFTNATIFIYRGRAGVFAHSEKP